MAFALDGKLSLDARAFVQGTDKAKRAVGEVGDAFGRLPDDAKSSARGVESEFGKLPGEGRKFGKKLSDDFGSAVSAMPAEAQSASKGVQARLDAINVSGARDEIGELGDEFGKLPAEARQAASKAADNIEGELDDAGGIGEAFGGKLGGAMVAGFGAVGVGAIIMDGLEKAFAAQQGQKLLEGQFRVTAETAERYGKIAGDLYADNWGSSLVEVQQAVATTAQRIKGVTDTELAAISEGILAVSSTWGVDFNEVLRSTTQLLENGLAPTAQAALNLVTAGFQAGGDEAGDLLDTIDEYSQHWGALGLSGEEALNQVIHGLQNGQRDTDKLADAVKEFRLRAVEDTDTVSEAYSDLGLDADELRKNIVEGGPAAKQAFLDVVGALKAVEDPVERNTLAVQFLGTQFEDLGPKGLDSLTAIEGTLGDVETAVEDLSGSIEATPWEKTQRRIEVGARGPIQGLLEDFEAFSFKAGNLFSGGQLDQWTKYADQIGLAERKAKEFDTTLLNGLTSYDEVRAAAKRQADTLGLSLLPRVEGVTTATDQYVNLVTNQWAAANKAQEMQLKGVGSNLLDVRDAVDNAARSTEDATDATDDNTDALGDNAEALDLAARRADATEAAYKRMSDQLSERSAYLNVQDGLADVRAEFAETGEVSERTSIAMQEDLIAYGEEVGNIPAETVTRISALIAQGDFDRAEAIIANLVRTRTAQLRIVPIKTGGITYRDQNGNVVAQATARGTDFARGGLTLVGEEGPEIVEMPRGARVHTAQATRAMMAESPAGLAPVTHNRTTITNPTIDTTALAQAVTAAMPTSMILEVDGQHMTAHVRHVLRNDEREKLGAL